MSELASIFPTIVGVYKIDIDFDLVYEILKKYKSEEHILLENSKSSWNQNSNILFDENLDYLREKIEEYLEKYSSSIGIKPLHIVESWYNEMKKGTKIITHRHEGSVVSGAFYIRANHESVPLRFMSPLRPYKMNELYERNDTEYSTSGVQFKPEIGTLLLFPSWLEHETDPEVGTRCVISFNTLYKCLFS
jgi:uncharacterized protein (TIGR02466 family)